MIDTEGLRLMGWMFIVCGMLALLDLRDSRRNRKRSHKSYRHQSGPRVVKRWEEGEYGE